MAEDHDLRQRRSRGEKAEKLLKNPLLVEAFGAIEHNLHAKLDGLKVDDIDRYAPEFVRQLRAVSAVKEMIRTYITHGKIAADELERTRG